MPRQSLAAVEHNFVGGLKTEFTGMNFPENACTDTYDCVFSRTGKVKRRLGFITETNVLPNAATFTSKAISQFKWENAGGDGNVKILVTQIGGTLHFFRYSTATVASPISTQKLASTVALSSFVSFGLTLDTTKECTYASGNGYLFVFNPNTEPFYCTYSAGTITATQITVQTRDFVGIPETIPDDQRTASLTNPHYYNLQNQGWSGNPAWTGTSSSSVLVGGGSKSWTIQTGLTITGGTEVTVYGTSATHPSDVGLVFMMSGTVTSYTSGTGALVLNIVYSSALYNGNIYANWRIIPSNSNRINDWFTPIGNYPSNADVWWRYKNSSGVFAPATTEANVNKDAAPAPKGHFILDEFFQIRSIYAPVNDALATKRPRIGAWFQGRVWYSGVDLGSLSYSDGVSASWTEKIYFSQIIEKDDQFGKCYQINDPTSEDRFDLLPSDGGVIRIQGCGTIYKLFPIQSGMLVFAANGIWFITGSQGIGFTATDFAIPEVSKVQSISETSFVSVNGLPVWWNEEGIYTLTSAQNSSGERTSGFTVNSLTQFTIDSFFAEIPLVSKQYARGDYNPLTYTIQWVFRSTVESSTTTRYQFNRILNFDTSTQAFFPWTISSGGPQQISGIAFIPEPNGGTDLESIFKYFTTHSTPSEVVYFSEASYVNHNDWGQDYTSYFVTGYAGHGQFQKPFQTNYVFVYSDISEATSYYYIQNIWDFANSGNSGKWSSRQLAQHLQGNFDVVKRRFKIRGSGFAGQMKVTSLAGYPFNLIGWSRWETVNAHP